MEHLTLILGNQLFARNYYDNFPSRVFMCEDVNLCSHFNYHKHKIMHFLISMREYADQLRKAGKKMTYHKLDARPHFFSRLMDLVEKENIKIIEMFEIEDKFFEREVMDFCHKNNIELIFNKSPMFICSREEFKEFLLSVDKPIMNSFYIRQRKKLEILMKDGAPIGGKWSFDQHNRKKIPKKFTIDQYRPSTTSSTHLDEVTKLIEKYFSHHPGRCDNFWLVCNRDDALASFRKYLKERFIHFGDFQDAIDTRAPFLYHSIISPYLNIGFLDPQEIVEEIIEFGQKEKIDFNNIEGFVRQVIGWRDFLRGIYQNFESEEKNFFKHKRKLTNHWYDATTGIPPLDDAIIKAQEWGYCHHIERLMIIGNLMLMLQVDPKEVYRWFMEFFVDSSDWVMAPNIFGMSQFSDGGLFATKPYISGSNYLLKMSHYKKGDWCDGVDGLYWSFIERNKIFFSSNHRMNMMVASVEKMQADKKKRIYQAADELRKRLTRS